MVHRAFSGVGAIVALFVPAECPQGVGGIFGKPLNRSICNTLGLHAVLTTCLIFSSVLDSACVACCLLLSTGSHHVRIQIHATSCCISRCTTETFGLQKSTLWRCKLGAGFVWVKSGYSEAIPWRKGGALSAVRAQCNYLGVWPD